jgi:hypothetical protein
MLVAVSTTLLELVRRLGLVGVWAFELGAVCSMRGYLMVAVTQVG